MGVYMEKQSLSVYLFWASIAYDHLGWKKDRWKLLMGCYRTGRRYGRSGEHRERDFTLLLRLFLQEPTKCSQGRLGTTVRKPSLWGQLEEGKSSLYQNTPGQYPSRIKALI